MTGPHVLGEAAMDWIIKQTACKCGERYPAGYRASRCVTSCRGAGGPSRGAGELGVQEPGCF